MIDPATLQVRGCVKCVLCRFYIHCIQFTPFFPLSQVKAILDWELSTIGNPWADVAYNCLPYYLPQGKWGRAGVWPWGDHRQTHNCLPYYLPQSQRGRSGV